MPRTLISFCTSCMDRLHHLRRTLPQNLADNDDYADLEVVLLDYNSRDGLGEWVQGHLAESLQNGRLRYFRTTEPRAFHHSHSRNLSFRLARGEVLCNVDADNFTGPGFARFVHERFTAGEDVFLAVDFDRRDHLAASFGRICVRRRHFLEVAGYDEAMSGYGWEDRDLCARLERLGLEALEIDDERYLRYLDHGLEERVRNTVTHDGILEVYHAVRPEWQVPYRFILRKNGTFRRFGLPADAPLKLGVWSRHRSPAGDELRLCWLEGHEETLERRAEGSYLLETAAGPFVLEPITESTDLLQLAYELSMIETEAVYRQNLESAPRVNPDGFGRGTVCEGFSGRLLRVG